MRDYLRLGHLREELAKDSSLIKSLAMQDGMHQGPL